MAAGVIIFSGPTGAGKSLQAERLARKHGWVHLSSGVIFRNSSDPRVVEALAAGELVDSEIADEVIRQALRDIAAGEVIALDGFPRKLEEVEWFDAELKLLDREISQVIVLDISREESGSRLADRGRGDDGASQQQEKWDWYAEDVLPIIALYDKRGLVTHVDGAGTPDEITSRLEQVLADAN